MLQKLWQLGLEWDEAVPLEIHGLWSHFYSRLKDINELQVPRQAFCFQAVNFQLHGFNDASEMAYAACVYVRSTSSQNINFVNLLTAKSRVTPLKKKLTIPKLELCGALLLSRLMSKVSEALHVNPERIHYYSDSTIVLRWISTEPHILKTFVANRITEIQQLTSEKQWHHVKGTENPADILTRGLNPDQLADSQLWWHGPEWLLLPEETWTRNNSYDTSETLPELKPVEIHVMTLAIEDSIFEKYSSLLKLNRVIAYVIRFCNNSKVNKGQRINGPLTVNEMQFALKYLIKIAQNQEFSQEIRLLQENKNIESKSRILSLSPFLDTEGILRVGGRLKRGLLPYDTKHQIILPKKHKLTELLINNEHKRNLHAGPQTLLAILRQQYWPISGKNVIKNVLRKCLNCFKTRPIAYEHLMGSLPKERITPSRAFSVCGLDYAGPFEIKSSKIRNAKRFISRRGKPAHIYSDNGTNFVGAKNSLYAFFEFLKDHGTQQAVFKMLSRDSITWHMIPPRSPHFGGLWESAVKSAKTHLKRVIGSTSLTFEELTTLMTQVESVLNSRPLTPMSSNPDDFTFLTPGHFLIGDSLTALPQPDLLDLKPNRLTKYQHLTQMTQHFWRRWSLEYLSTLQQRHKWSKNYQPIKTGDVVLIKDENQPPMKWSLGRVQELYIGEDGVTRVVNIKNSSGVIKRSIRKLCPLPMFN